MKKIILLCSKDESSAAVFNRINSVFPINAIIEENSIPRSKILLNRMKKQGVKKVFGQC